MFGLGGILVCVCLIYISGKAAKFFNRLARDHGYEKRKKEYYMKETAEAARAIAEGIRQPEKEEDYVSNLVKANKELMEKRKFDKAVKDELGISMDPE